MLKEDNQIKLREQLLVEKCINSLIIDYEQNIESEYVNAEIDFKLDFLSFLTTNLPEEVEYGIKYLTKYPKEYKILMPMILEYRTYGLSGQLECKPIPKDRCYCTEPTKDVSNTNKNIIGELINSIIDWFKK